MKSLISPTFGEPTGYVVREGSEPAISSPSEILITVNAASINGHDVIMASGRTKAVQNVQVPYTLGLDFAGRVAAKGAAVGDFEVGDVVYGFVFHVGTVATQIIVDTARQHALAKSPSILSPVEAASLPAVGITAMLALNKADQYFERSGGLRGKTVFIPAALSGVGSIALQIAKIVWGCRTITAVSTSKIPLVNKLLGENVVDQTVDYTKNDLVESVGHAQIDFVLDTTGKASDYMPIIKKGGFCLSIARLPPGSALKEDQQPRTACIGQTVMNGLDTTFRLWASTRYGVTYVYQKTDPVSADLEALSRIIEDGAVKPVVGSTAALDDLETIKVACTQILNGKGAIGKFVVTM